MDAPCQGQWELFDSIDIRDHDQARRLCHTCPLIAACRTKLATAREAAYDRRNGPRGTWAGEFLAPAASKRPARSPRTIAAEDAMFTDDEARLAHNAWTRGDDDSPRVAIGERVYQRRIGRIKRARKRAA